tara:strand:- start:1104 stop:1367 length:264 start_codon:yes stop_codon:yes gene_type:complete
MPKDVIRDRVINSINSDNPLSLAIVSYQAIRESSAYAGFKSAGDKDGIVKMVFNSVSDLVVILGKYGWERKRIDEFLDHVEEIFKGL